MCLSGDNVREGRQLDMSPEKGAQETLQLVKKSP